MSYRWLARTAAAVGVAAVTLIGASSAWASTDINIPLNDGPLPTTADEFDTQECDGPFEDLEQGTDGWHFVLPAGEFDFVTLTLEFEDESDNPVTVIIDSTDPNNPSAGPGWSGYIDSTGAGQSKHAYVFTDSGWELQEGDADITGPDEPNNTPEQFQLSHTCVGETPPTSPPRTTPPGTTTTTAPPDLPKTGVALGGLITVAAGLVIGGTLLLIARRRRDGATDSGAANS